MDLTTPGVFALTDSMTGNQIAGFVRKIEKLGYGSSPRNDREASPST